jgi:ABC-2 type transport system ATP-binding protein
VTSAVEARGIRYRYGARVALDGVDVAAAPGELVGLIGPNGSGKSTLFGVLAGLLRAEAGTVRIEGAPGVVFQHPSLDRTLTVRENLAAAGRLHGLSGSRLRAAVADAVSAAGLEARADDRAATLSGGLQRRAELARALLHGPKVLLLDEPASALDPAARGEFWARLESLRRDRRLAVIVATHDLEEADRCDRVSLLHEGRVAAEGTPAGLKASLGAPVVSVRARDPRAVAALVRDRFGVDSRIVDSMVRFAHPNAHALVAPLGEVLGDGMLSISVSRPSLEAVFVRLTGRGLGGA